MRKLTLLMSMMLLLTLSYGQSQSIVKQLNQRETAKISNVKNLAAAKITSLNKYAPGTTMNLLFSIYAESPDYEYVDYVEMNFPSGLVPTGASDPLCKKSSASASPMDLHLNGQKVSWGSQNNFGGMKTTGTYEFYVTVEVAANLTGNQEISFTVSGDGYGSAPHDDITGTITIVKIPDVPDLTSKATSFFVEYYAVPVDQVTSTIRANVSNLGNTLTEATNFTIKNSNNSFNNNLPITTPMSPNSTESFAFTGYTPVEGNEEFIFTANASNDFDATNANDTAKIHIGGTDLIRDNGKIVQGFGIGKEGGILGNVFYIGKEDVLNSVQTYHVKPTFGETFNVVIYSINAEGAPDTLMATSYTNVYIGLNMVYTSYFDGVTLPEGYYFIGVVEGAHNMNLGLTSTPNYVDGTAWGYWKAQNESSPSWKDLGALGYKQTYYIRPQFGTELPNFDMKMFSLDIYKYHLKDSTVTVKGVLHNKGIDALTAVDVAYSVNGGTPVVQSLTAADLGAGLGLIPFEMTEKISLNEVGNYNIKVWLANPNGSDDADLNNDTLSTLLSALEYAPVKRIFGEEATGTWCGWCVRGHVYMDSMELKYPDTWVGVAVHNNDPMAVQEYDTSMAKHIGGYPSGLINRDGKGHDPLHFENAYLTKINDISPVDLSLTNVNYNGETKELTFAINAKFLGNVKNARFNAVIIENEINKDETGYAQVNYYAGGGYGAMGGYENKPNPVPAADMTYQNVARAILGGWDGTESSIPETVNNDDNATYTYTITLNSDWDAEKIAIAGIVIAEDGSILNAVKGDIHTGIEDKTADNNTFSIYPNPFNNTVTFANMDNAKKVIISNVIGQKVMTVDVNSAVMTVNTSNLNSGVYLISIVDINNNITTVRMVKQ
jgi:hypothetical protein